MWRFGGREEGRGVSYRIEETAAGADQEGRLSAAGRGDIFRWRALYARAEVEEVVCCCRDWRGVKEAIDWDGFGLRVSFGEREQRARRAAIVGCRGVHPVQRKLK